MISCALTERGDSRVAAALRKCSTTVALPPLPIDARLGEVREALARKRAVVISAFPGAGKTTRIPPSLTDAGPVILLQPRRVAVRAVARRIAEERGWAIGGEVGWQVRFEKRFRRDTRLLVVTEGILTARLQHDPLLSEFSTVILDEFHERSIHADLGLALARQAWRARDDLRIVVMSATMDIARVADFLDDAPVIEVPGALHPLAVEYAEGQSVPDAARDVLSKTSGQILCFLPGSREIEQARAELAAMRSSGMLPQQVDIVPLHGSLEAGEQDDAVSVTTARRIILATNIAETSLTVPGVTAVIDTGRVKVARYDTERGIDSLTLERVTQDSAEQRAGRAARLAPGLVRRLWDQRDRLRPHRDADIARIDLAGPLLDVLAWGGVPNSFEWFEAPSADRLEAAIRVLRRLGAIDRETRITSAGRRLQRVPVHPRIAAILLDGRGAPEVSALCARLSDGSRVAAQADPRQRQLAAQLQRIAGEVLEGAAAAHVSDAELRHALFAGYADRLARRRPGSQDRFLLATGHGATLARESHDVSAEFIVALDVVAAEREGIGESRIRAASAVDRDWIQPTDAGVEHWFDTASGRVRAARVEKYDAIVLNETPVAVDPEQAAVLLRDAWLARDRDAGTARLLLRARFAAVEIDLVALAGQAAVAARNVDDITAGALEALLPFAVKRALDDRAPESVAVPSGRRAAVEYAEDGSVSAKVKLQELFGLAESPLLGAGRVPLTFHLLAPNGRPVQTTRDLRSFWERTYPEVRKELRARYPRHPWPEDPWTAPPTHRTVRRP